MLASFWYLFWNITRPLICLKKYFRNIISIISTVINRHCQVNILLLELSYVLLIYFKYIQFLNSFNHLLDGLSKCLLNQNRKFILLQKMYKETALFCALICLVNAEYRTFCGLSQCINYTVIASNDVGLFRFILSEILRINIQQSI